MRNTLNWFELFVSDMPRAKAFYEQMLATKLGPHEALLALQGHLHSRRLVDRPMSRRPVAQLSLNCPWVQ